MARLPWNSNGWPESKCSELAEQAPGGLNISEDESDAGTGNRWLRPGLCPERSVEWLLYGAGALPDQRLRGTAGGVRTYNALWKPHIIMPAAGPA